jgi:hypothetical protein
MSTFTTGNPVRDELIAAAIAQAIAAGHTDLTVAVVEAFLPPEIRGRGDFDLQLEEVAGLTPLPEGEIAAVESTEPVEGPGGTLPGDVAAAEMAVSAATDALVQSRANVNILARRLNEALTARAKAVSQFQAKISPLPQWKHAKDVAVAALQQRAAVAAGLAQPPELPVAGPSVVDRQATFSRPGIEGSGNHRRAVLMGGTGQPIFPAAKRGSRLKLPSQR